MFKSCLAGLLAMVMVAGAVAQSVPEPAIVVSMSSVKDQMADVKYLVKQSGFGKMNFLIKSQVDHFTRGIDAKRPMGVLMYFEGDNPMPRTVGFLPVENLDDLLDTVSGFAEVDVEDDFIVVTPDNAAPVFLKESGTHVFISDSEESFGDLPEDPAAMLGDLPGRYNVAAHVFGSRIPEELRESAIDMIKDGYMQQLQNMGDPVAAEEQMENFEEQIKSLEDIDEIVFGMLADKETHKMAMEFTFTGKPGSKLADSYKGFADVKPTRFAGFMNDKSAVDYSMCFRVSENDAEQFKKAMDSSIEAAMTELDNDGDFEEEDMETIRNSVMELKEVLIETFQNGRIDSGGQLMMGANDFNFVSGTEVSDPKRVEAVAKDLIGLLQAKAGDALVANLDFATHNGVNMHELVFVIPEDEEELQDFVGSELKVLLGIGEKDVYFAVGKDPMETLKAAMANSSNAAPEYPIIYNMRITPILEFAASTTGQPMLDDLIEKLKEVGRDKITAYSKPIENGVFSRIEMEDGPLALIQTAVTGFQQAMGADSDF
jgi:hypothetical protein